MSKRPQAAMEFLFTYGWAILVAIGALLYLGVLDPSILKKDECMIGPGFDCREFEFTRTNVIINVLNSQPKDFSPGARAELDCGESYLATATFSGTWKSGK